MGVAHCKVGRPLKHECIRCTVRGGQQDSTLHHGRRLLTTQPSTRSIAETLKIGPDGGIAELGKKPKSYDEIEGQYIGVMRFSPEAVGEMRALWVELAEEGPEARWDNKDR